MQSVFDPDVFYREAEAGLFSPFHLKIHRADTDCRNACRESFKALCSGKTEHHSPVRGQRVCGIHRMNLCDIFTAGQ